MKAAVPFIPTADMVARMVIAACDELHTDPLRAFEVTRGQGRTALLGTAVALSRSTGLTNLRVAAMLGVSSTSLATAKHNETAQLGAAREAASDVLMRWRGVPSIAPKPEGVTPIAPDTLGRDRRPEILAAMAKLNIPLLDRPIKVEVVGVEKDKALLPAAKPGDCAFPLGDLQQGTYRACGDPAVEGRRYCAVHCKAAGLPTKPKVIERVGRVAGPVSAAGY